MDPDQDAPTSRRSHHGRPFLIVASLAPFVTVMAFLWFRSEGVAAASGEDAATIARIVCRGGTTTIETPIVRARSDGVHLEIAADVEGLKFSVENDHGGTEGWELTPSTTYPFAWTSWLPPGKVRAQCGTSAGVADGPAFEVIDPEGLWHDNHLWCVETDDFDSRGGSFGFYGDVNPLPEAIARAVPGVRTSDVISYAGYPQAPDQPASPSYRIIRDGRVVAVLGISSYDDRWFTDGMFSCDTSEIGMAGEPTAGQLATPFELPGLAHCDPYTASCSSVYLTVSRYAAMRGEDPARYSLPEMPWAACLADQPEGCPADPEEDVLQILLASADAELFVSEQGCGSSESTACSGDVQASSE